METAAKTGTAGHVHSGAAALHHNAVPDIMPATEGALPFFGGMPVQAKLEVSPPDDPQEREADQVADTVMRMPEAADTIQPYATPSSGEAVHRFPEPVAWAPVIQRKCDACEAEETVQRFPEPAIQREDIVQRKCAACEQEDAVQRSPEPPVVQRKCAACEAEETVQRFPEPAIQREDIVQRKCDACEQEEAVQRSPELPVVQRKCAACEAEETVQRFPVPAARRTSVIQRSCEECAIDKPSTEETAEDAEVETSDIEKGSATDEAEDNGTISPKSGPGGTAPVSSGFETGLQSSKGGGQPMAEPVRQSMENRFGQDFSHVRIHSNHAAANLSASINAQAFTHGQDIYFNQNKYDGTSASGQRLLAHELTHVIQQTGASAIKPKVQRSEDDRKGNWAHKELQERMRNHDPDKKLITEAGIPGAVRDDKGLNMAGFADLYKAGNNAVSGMQIKETAKGYDYQEFMKSGVRKAAMKGPFVRGPVKKGSSWDFSVNFPSTFSVGEIKPLFFAEFGLKVEDMVGSGILQLDNYLNGFREFVEHVHSVFPAATATTTGKEMEIARMLPPSINYDHFDAEHTKKDKDSIFKKNSNQRVWIADLGKGMAGYFLMPHPYIPTEFAEDKKKHRDRLDSLIKSLREKGGKPKMPPAVSAKLIPGREKIQKKDKDPNADAKAWEKERKAWANGTDPAAPQKPKKFLKEKAKGLLKRHKVDKKLKKTTPTDPAKDIKDVKDVQFWSSFKGRVYGALRFRFRRAFEKMEELFQKIKTKFEKHREKSKSLKGGGGFSISWKKEAVNLIVQLAADIFQRMIALAFAGFSKCMDTIIDAVIGKYEKALQSAAEEELKLMEPTCCEIMKFKNLWEAEVEKHEKVIKGFTEAVDTMREWTAILDKVEIAVRLGVQIISCGTPPALGCLWGLVAQLGISAGMSLLQRTSYWKENIAQPAAEALMEAVVGDSLHELMRSVLLKTPLAPYMDGENCGPRKKGQGGGGGGLGAIGQGLDKIDPNDPAIVKARQEWEAEWKDKMMADLQEVFESGEKGKKMTPEELQKLVEAIKKSGKTPEEIKKMIESGRNTKSGKVDLTKALATVSSGTVPADAPKKERKINYDKAKANNKYYAGILGWVATLFIKKPGIQPGSEEFADAVYDLQEALGIHADGIAGAGTTQKFYEANGLTKDGVYTKAGEVLTREKEARDQQKAQAENKKQLDALLADPKVKEALDKPFPADTQLKKDLNGYGDWDSIPVGTGRFVDFGANTAVVIVTANGSKIGAYVKSAEREEGGKKYIMTLVNSPFYAIDAVVEDAFAISVKSLDGKTEIIRLFFLLDQAAGSMLQQSEVFFFGIRRNP